uniref:Putative secreted protein n=1 Tax=Lutzomyia longipalpis TaxID=7200 RepID=A0A7G3AMK8_LUTLO
MRIGGTCVRSFVLRGTHCVTLTASHSTSTCSCSSSSESSSLTHVTTDNAILFNSKMFPVQKELIYCYYYYETSI